MTRPERRFDDRTVPEDRFHIGAPAPGHDNGQRWQYAEGGACVDAGARNVLGVVDTTPICRVRADSDDTRRSTGALESRGQRETACRGFGVIGGRCGYPPRPVGCRVSAPRAYPVPGSGRSPLRRAGAAGQVSGAAAGDGEAAARARRRHRRLRGLAPCSRRRARARQTSRRRLSHRQGEGRARCPGCP
jgi:hypothetical protein